MSYTALYRKFRPKRFEDVIGQKTLIETLTNQITMGSIGHAYLFTGTRGTGKTSTAKLLSRAINCLSPDGINPCNECEVCQGILNESLMDIIELDAASNNGVDDIREIRENVKYPPSKAKYKVYIIDEVHMLSQGAFNALLKTLEEPPLYVVFILATTEPHKIPDTIHSRCQRFDFKRVTSEDLLERLKFICDELGLEYEDRALKVIIRKGEGAVRDSLSVLEKCISFSSNKLTYDMVVETLGLVDDIVFMKLTDSIIEENAMESMKMLDEIISSGRNTAQFLKDYIQYIRDLMLVKSSERLLDMIDGPEATKEGLQRQANEMSLNNIIRVLNILTTAENEMKWASNQRIHLEMTFMKAIELRMDDSKESLIERVSKLEKLLKGIESGSIPVQTTNQSTSSAQRSSGTSVTKRSKSVNKNDKATTVNQLTNDEIDYSDKMPSNFNTIKENWDNVLAIVKKKRVSTHAFLIEGVPAFLEGDDLYIGFDDRFGFHMEAVSRPENRVEIERAIYHAFKFKVNIKCDYLANMNISECEQEPEDNEEEIREFFDGVEDKLEIIK